MSKKPKTQKKITKDTPFEVKVGGETIDALITRSLESTAELFINFVKDQLVPGKNGRVKICPTFKLESKEHSKAAIEKIRQKVNALDQNKEKNPDKRLNEVYTLVMMVEELPKTTKKDWWGSELGDAVEKVLEERFPRALILFGWYHAHRLNVKLARDLKSAQEIVEIHKRKLNETRADWRLMNQTLLDVTQTRINESIFVEAPKGTLEHEVSKLADWTTNFKVTAITLFQIELEQKIPVDRLHVAQFIADVQFIMLQDIRRLRVTTFKLNEILSHLDFGRRELKEAAEANERLNSVLTELLEKLKDTECDETVGKLFQDSLDEHSEDEEFCDILNGIKKDWAEKLAQLDKFSPKDILLLSQVVYSVNNTTAKSKSGQELVPRKLKFEEGKARSFIATIYNTAAALRQIYKEGKLFSVEDKPEFDALRGEHLRYFKGLEDFIQVISTELNKENPRQLSELDGYREEFKDTLEDVYQELLDTKAAEELAKQTKNTGRFDRSMLYE